MSNTRPPRTAASRPVLLMSALAVLLGGGGCGSQPGDEPDAGAIDAGAIDAGAPDAGAVDSGTHDSGIDAGSSDAGPPDASTAFSWNNGCAGCHTNEANTTVATNPSLEGRLSLFHTANSSFTSTWGTQQGHLCEPCHVQAEPTLTTIHASPTGAVPTKLVKTEVPDTTCLTCHVSYAALAALTVNSTVLTDTGTSLTENGVKKVVNPHLAPTLTQAHIDVKMGCKSCHGSHKTTSAIDYCVSCHHEGVWECKTCHK